MKNLDPLLEVWDLFMYKFKAIDNMQFIKDIAILIFCIYTNLLSEYSEYEVSKEHGIKRVTLVDIFVLYGKVSLIPVRELLNLLDLCYVRFDILLQEYEFFSDRTWGEWFQKHWWVPPVIAISLIYNIFYQQYVENQSFGGGYLLE